MKEDKSKKKQAEQKGRSVGKRKVVVPKSIALLTSGGDSPGMNCAIRAVVRSAIAQGLTVWGIRRGYAGLLEGDMEKMSVASVGNIIQRGGTVLGTSRCLEFVQKETRKEAANILKRKEIDGLIVIGGDGSFNGAMLLHRENEMPVVGIPGTIDNDITGTEYTIGFSTAVQTAVDAVDKIRDTASSHARIFIVEVMGRNSPAIALHTGIGCGAEYVVTNTMSVEYDDIAYALQRGINRGKTSSIVIVAEGHVAGRCFDIQKYLQEKYLLQSHVCVLGHIQRGGIPCSSDRVLASQMGNLAVTALLQGNTPSATALVNGRIVLVPLENCLKKNNSVDPLLVELVTKLSI